MVSSRSVLFLVAALALPLSVFSGCSDDSPAREEPRDEDDDETGETTDARVRQMDATVRNDGGASTSGDGATDEENDDAGGSDDAGEQPAQDAGPSGDGGSGQDAAAEGMDAATDAGKADATVDSGKSDAGDAKIDAAEPEEDAGEEAEEDAGPQDAGQQTDADAGKADAAQPDAGDVEELTEADCDAANGEIKNPDQTCGASEIKYEIENDQICCVPGEQEEGVCGGPSATACPNGQFCDTSKLGGGDGCGVTTPFGKCRPVPTSCPPGVLSPGCDCQNQIYLDKCSAWLQKVPVEACFQ